MDNKNEKDQGKFSLCRVRFTDTRWAQLVKYCTNLSTAGTFYNYNKCDCMHREIPLQLRERVSRRLVLRCWEVQIEKQDSLNAK